MATKHITDVQVCRAARPSETAIIRLRTVYLLRENTGQCEKVCIRAIERAAERGYVAYSALVEPGSEAREKLSVLRERIEKYYKAKPGWIWPPVRSQENIDSPSMLKTAATSPNAGSEALT